MGGWERKLAELVDARAAALKRYAYLLCGDDREAEDLVQDALLRAFTYRRAGDVEQLEPYVRKIILNLFLDRARRRRIWARLRLLAAAPIRVDDHRLDSVVDRHDVRAALLSLSPRQRACVVLRYYLDLPVETIAERLGCSQGTVKRHLHDGRGRLIELLGSEEVQKNGSK